MQPSLTEIQEADRERIRNAQKQSRRKTHRMPVTQAHGPSLPWPWQRASSFMTHDCRPANFPADHDFSEWIFLVLNSALEGDFRSAYDQLVQEPYHGQLAAQLTAAFQAQQPSPAMPNFAESHLVLQEAITLWQETELIPVFSPCLKLRYHEVHITLKNIRLQPITQGEAVVPQDVRRQHITSDLWEQDDVISQIHRQLAKLHHQQYVYPDIDPICSINSPIFFTFFR